MKRIWILLPVLAVAVVASALLVTFTITTTRAVQAPEISLDMDPTGNTYDETTNSMAIGTIENCLGSATANPATHTHPAHLLIRNVEDLVAYQVRLNYIGDQLRPSVFNPTPFTDNTLSQSVGFVNLPIDSVSGVHLGVTPAVTIPNPPPDGSNTSQTALVGAAYNGNRDFPFSPDTPAKTTPDETTPSYSAPSGGILGALILQVTGDESGQASLLMDLDDNAPNPPGSSVVVWTGSEVTTPLAESALFDGFHAEGAAACQVVDVRNHTFRNTTGQTANDLHVQFSGPIDPPELVTNAPSCTTAPTFSGDNAACLLDAVWTETCVANGEEVVIRITSAGVQRSCSDWTLNGTALGPAQGDTACTAPTPTATPLAPTPTRTPRTGAGTATPTRAAPAALPPTGAGDGGELTLAYALLLASLAVPVSGAVYGVVRLRRK